MRAIISISGLGQDDLGSFFYPARVALMDAKRPALPFVLTANDLLSGYSVYHDGSIAPTAVLPA